MLVLNFFIFTDLNYQVLLRGYCTYYTKAAVWKKPRTCF